MSANDAIHITPGMQRYIDKNNAYLAERERYIREVVKKSKFDTIAVHGLYTMEDALEDYQGIDHRADLHEHGSGVSRLR